MYQQIIVLCAGLTSAAEPGSAQEATPRLGTRLALGASVSRRGMLGLHGQSRASIAGALGVDLRLSRSVTLSLDASVESARVATPSFEERSRALFVLIGPEFAERWFYWRPGFGIVRLLINAPQGRVTQSETAPACGLAVGRRVGRIDRHPIAVEAIGRMRIAGGMELRTTTFGLQLVGRW